MMKALLKEFEIGMPKTLVGVNASSQIGALSRELGAKKAIIVSDPGIIRAGLINVAKASLEKEGIACDIFDNCPQSAPLSSIKECVKLIQNTQCDVVIGIGGGSVMDLAKMAVSVAAHEGDISILYDPKKIIKSGVPTIFAPTTSGTGSEVSWGAVFTDDTDENDKRKKAVKSDYLFAHTAVLDPLLTLNLPPAITADTGMDVLAHAIEGYTSVKANIVADMFAEKAIRLVAENLRLAYAKGSQNIEARYNMMIAASLAITVLRSSASYIVHSFSYPVGMMGHLGHGAACALTLPYVMEFNLIGNPEKFASVAELMGESVEGLTIMEKAARSVGAVKKLMADIRLPLRLPEVGIGEKDIPEMVDYVYKYHSYQIEANPRELSREDLENILKSAL